MLRYIIRYKFKQINGCEGSRIYTIDGKPDEVEHDLKGGGFGEDTYDFHEVIGVEIISPKEKHDSETDTRRP